MKVWDYKIPKNWKPKTKQGWLWYLEKMIATGNLKRLKAAEVKKYLPRLKLDEGNRLLLKHYFFRRNGE
jgi:hypothetical protein